MATIAENLQILKDSTDAIKQAIIDKGGNISGGISTWASAITGIRGDVSAEKEFIFTGTISWNLMNCTIQGSLDSRPEDMISGYLVAIFKNSTNIAIGFVSISIGIKNKSITCNYDEPPSGNEIPALFIVYAPTDQTKIVPVTFKKQLSTDPT